MQSNISGQKMKWKTDLDKNVLVQNFEKRGCRININTKKEKNHKKNKYLQIVKEIFYFFIKK